MDALAQLTFAVQAALAGWRPSTTLSIPAARLLGIVRDRQPTIGELATFLQLDKSSVTGLVDRAAERGLVARTASPLDRRSVRVAHHRGRPEPSSTGRGRLRSGDRADWPATSRPPSAAACR